MRPPFRDFFVFLKTKQFPITTVASFFLILVCCTLVALNGWLTWHSRTLELLEGEASAFNLARSLAQQATDAIIKVDANLKDLVERIEVDGTDSAQLARITKLLKSHDSKLPTINRVLIIGKSGYGLASPLGQFSRQMNFSDREYFQFHRDNPERGLHVGPALQSRINGEWIIPITRRLNNADGSFAGVVVAVIPMSYFQQFYDSFNIGPSGMICMVLNSGAIVARRPMNAKLLTQNISTGEFFINHIAKFNDGIALVAGKTDGKDRIYAYRHLDNLPLVVIAGLAQEDVLAVWKSDAIQHAGIVSILVFVIAGLGFRFVRQVKKLSQVKDDLEKSHEQLRQLTEHQEHIKEEERVRIARDIHDDLGQNLLALKVDAAMLHARTSNTHIRLNKRAHTALQNIDATIASVKTLINDLRPATLNLGLLAAADWQLKQHARINEVACRLISLDIADDCGLDPERTTAIFRILQEALVNIAKHAQATEVVVTLTSNTHHFSMSVMDNGKGMQPADRKKLNAFGLIGMQERIRTLAGEFYIESLAQGTTRGTTLTVTIPLIPAPENTVPAE